ncbi:MAG: thioredoxin domain-containing protein [Solirubrobacterales bacterium]
MSNRLANESSPYLRQHAENPVDWYPWGADALARARDEDKPILLSIGYAACHWCHVMAHESFENESTAAYMNDHFVNIKVDREERPDIDAIYMEAAQAMSGHGGWPLTAFLTPTQVPFFAGTYFPPEPLPGRPSFVQLMTGVLEAWTARRDEIERSHERIVEALSMTARLKAPDEPLTAETLAAARASLSGAFDERFGGFGGAPKFPAHSVLDFLLGSGDARSIEVALATLSKMAAGGIHDQIGGGFARYSVDERWHVPHFEKMLYDNALLARNYLHAWQVSGNDEFADTCKTTLDWMLTELRGDEGGFASALDADSLDATGHREEGAFYVWDKDELAAVAGGVAPDALDDLLTYWGVIDDGEFEGRNVLFVNAPERRPSDASLESIRAALYEHRAKRSWPARDDKRVTSWNALAIAALAEAGGTLGEPRYLDAAVAATEFVERESRTADGRLRRSWLGGRSGPPGYLEDYAYVSAAYLTLYEHTFDERWFVLARSTADLMVELFADGEAGGFFSTAHDHEKLLVRRKDLEDSPIPGGNAAAALALLRLSALTGAGDYRTRAGNALRILQPMAVRYPSGFGHALQAIAFYLGPVREVALIGDRLERFTAVARTGFRPRVVLAGGPRKADPAVPLLRGRATIDGRSAAYVCENFTCRRPVTDVAEFRSAID